MLSKQRTLTLSAGDRRQLTFQKGFLSHKSHSTQRTGALVFIDRSSHDRTTVRWAKPGASSQNQQSTDPVFANKAFQSLDEASVEEIMMPHAVTLTPDMTCKEAARMLLSHDISSAPVLDDKGKLVGILSESDLLWKGAGVPLDHTIIPPVFVGAFDLLISLRDSKQVQEEVDKILARTVGQAMTKNPASIKPTASLSDAALQLLKHKVHSMPVVDDAGQVVGLISQHDILRGMVAEQLPLLS